MNQQTEEVGTGYVSLEEIEKYVGNNKEMTKMAERKRVQRLEGNSIRN